MSSITVRAKEFNDITECPICIGPYVDPRLLPCVHTFCLKCIDKYGKSQDAPGEMPCPLCRQSFIVPSGGMKKLPINFFVLKLLEIKRISNKQNEVVACDLCDDEEGEASASNASFYCFDCQQNLCNRCCKLHKKIQYLCTHRVVDIRNAQPDDFMKCSPTFCEYHSEEFVKYYCSDCKKTICMSCYVEEHTLHKCHNFAKVVEEFTSKLQDDVERVSKNIIKFVDEAEKLKNDQANLLEEISAKENEVTKRGQDMCELVGKNTEKLLQELTSIKLHNLSELEKATIENDSRLIKMESFQRYCQEVINKATPADVSCLVDSLHERADELCLMQIGERYKQILVEILSNYAILSLEDKNDNGKIVVHRNQQGVCVKPLNISVNQSDLLDSSTAMLQEMTVLDQELYLIHRQSLKTMNLDFILTSVLALLLPSDCRSNVPQDMVLFRVQLTFSNFTLQIKISDVCLTYQANTSFQNSIKFLLPPYLMLENTSGTFPCFFPAPQGFQNMGYNSLYLTLQTNINSQTLSVTGSVQLQTLSTVLPSNFSPIFNLTNSCRINMDPSNVGNPPQSVIVLLPLILTNVYYGVTECTYCGVTKCSSCAGIVCCDECQDTEYKGNGTTCFNCGSAVDSSFSSNYDSMLLRVSFNISSTKMEMEISSPDLVLSGGSSECSQHNIDIYPMEIKETSTHHVGLATPTQLSQNGFNEFTFDAVDSSFSSNYDSMLLQVSFNISSTKMEMEISSPELVLSGGSSECSQHNIDIYPMEIKETSTHHVGLATPTQLSQYGFNELTFDLAITATSSSSNICLLCTNSQILTSTDVNSCKKMECSLMSVDQVYPTVAKQSFLLQKNTIGLTNRDFILTALMALEIPTQYAMSSYFSEDTLLFHVKLNLSNSSLQIELSNVQLTDGANNSLKTSLDFDLPEHMILKSFSESITCLLNLPQSFHNLGFYSARLTLQIISNSNKLTINNSLDEFEDSSSLPNHSSSISEFAKVYEINPNSSLADFPFFSGFIQVSLPQTFPGGQSYTNYTQCNSILFHATYTLLDQSRIKIDFSPPTLAVSNNNSSSLTSEARLNIYPMEMKNLDMKQTVTLTAPPQLVQHGFHELTFDSTVTSSASIVVMSFSNVQIQTVPTNSITSTINIQSPISWSDGLVQVSTAQEPPPSLVQVFELSSFKQQRQIFLNSLTDPTDITSCHHYDCLYVSDGESKSIHRLNSAGKSTSWKVNNVPVALSVSPSHNVIVTCKKSSKIIEFTTRGELVREFSINGISDCLSSCLLSSGELIFISGEETQAPLFVLDGTLPLKSSAGNSKETGKQMEKSEKKFESKASRIVTSRDKPEQLTSIELKDAVHMLVDIHGHIFVLADSKVHLVDPQLSQVKELIDLRSFGMESPRKMCIDSENGRLYVMSNAGVNRLLTFELNDRKLDSSAWMK